MCPIFSDPFILASSLSVRFEQAFVSSLVYGRSGDYFWTALQDQNGTGAFHWLSGDEVTYTNWNRDQPGEWGNHPFVIMGFSSQIGSWRTRSLHKSIPVQVKGSDLGD